jgi:hypothetical protein
MAIFNPKSLKFITTKYFAKLIANNQCPPFPQILDDWRGLLAILKQLQSEEKNKFLLDAKPAALEFQSKHCFYQLLKQLIIASEVQLVITDTLSEYLKTTKHHQNEELLDKKRDWYQPKNTSGIDIYSERYCNSHVVFHPDKTHCATADLTLILQSFLDIKRLRFDCHLGAIMNIASLLSDSNWFKITRLTVNARQICPVKTFNCPPKLTHLTVHRRQEDNENQELQNIWTYLLDDDDPQKVLFPTVEYYEGPIPTNSDLLNTAFPDLVGLTVTNIEGNIQDVTVEKGFVKLKTLDFDMRQEAFSEQRQLMCNLFKMSPRVFQLSLNNCEDLDNSATEEMCEWLLKMVPNRNFVWQYEDFLRFFRQEDQPLQHKSMLFQRLQGMH